MNLVYVNELGPNYKGDNIYEFIFSDLDDVWGDEWDAEPASGKPSPPDINYIKRVGALKNSEIELELIQNSDYFGVSQSRSNEEKNKSFSFIDQDLITITFFPC